MTTLTPDQTQAPNLPSVDGYLISASASEVILKTADGDQTFDVDEQDAPELGIEHLASHAGITTLGFRVSTSSRATAASSSKRRRSHLHRSTGPNEHV